MATEPIWLGVRKSQLAWSNGSLQGLASIGEMNGREGIAGHLTGRRKADGMSKRKTSRRLTSAIPTQFGHLSAQRFIFPFELDHP
jgi:hypothetical protein